MIHSEDHSIYNLYERYDDLALNAFNYLNINSLIQIEKWPENKPIPDWVKRLENDRNFDLTDHGLLCLSKLGVTTIANTYVPLPDNLLDDLHKEGIKTLILPKALSYFADAETIIYYVEEEIF